MADPGPNIIFIMSDDHASHAMSCYGSQINQTPNIDRIAKGGMRLDNCFCTNALCTPSRASILTGTYSHINGATTLSPARMNPDLAAFPQLLQDNGYQTAIFGKWHLGTEPDSCPKGFDDWTVLPGQGRYHNPEFICENENGLQRYTETGYVTDIVTDMSLDWLKDRNPDAPFCLLCHHKAPHRPWYPDEKHAGMFLNEDVPEPETLYDDYSNRASAAEAARMRVGPHMSYRDLKSEVPEELPEKQLRAWAYQRYIKDYLRVIASVDDNVGRLLDYLEEEGLDENTMVIYTSDQGFFLGDHGWFDKRFMYEEALRMPFIVKYPKEIEPGSVNDDIALNVDFPSLFLDLAGVSEPESFQGRSIRPLLRGETPDDWRDSMYYRYWMHGDGCHNAYAHYGIRTKRYKLIYYYADGLNQPGTGDEIHEPEWELFDLHQDPCELHNVYNDPQYASIIKDLKEELHRLQAELRDERYYKDRD